MTEAEEEKRFVWGLSGPTSPHPHNAEERVKQHENAAPMLGGRAGRRLMAAVSFPSGRDGAHDDTLAHTSWPVISGFSAICPLLPAGASVWLWWELISLCRRPPRQFFRIELQLELCKCKVLKKMKGRHYNWNMRKHRSWRDEGNIWVGYLLVGIPAGPGPMVIIQGKRCSMQRHHYVTSTPVLTL